VTQEILKKLQEEGRIPKISKCEESKKSKYGSNKTSIDGITFHSRKEAMRYCELKILERAGSIKDLNLQVKFEIHPKIVTEEGVTINKRSYIADFVYFDMQLRKMVIEDTKGFSTAAFRLKWGQMQERYGCGYVYLIT
jgi:hypothetical protein